MAEAFDPYRQWLGIHKDEQPPNHYRLLGVRIFENELTVIENAADRAMLHLRSLSLGPNSAKAQQLLNEISAARICLLDPQRKKEYDAQLEAKSRQSTASLPSLVKVVPLPVARVVPSRVQQTPINDLLVAAPFERQIEPQVIGSPRPSTPSTNRSARNGSFGWIEILKIVGGGLAGIVLAQVILFYALDVDLFGVMGHRAKDVTSVSPQTRTSNILPPEIPPIRPNPVIPGGAKSDGLQNSSSGIPVPPEIRQAPPNSVPPAPPSVPKVSPPPSEPQVPAISPETSAKPKENPRETVPSKTKVPSKEERVVLQKKLKETFSREFNKPPSRENKMALMDFLLQTAKSSAVNENDRFVLLSEALTCATTLKDFAKGAEIVDHLERLYEIEPLTLRSYYLGKFAETASKQEDRKSICICAIELADQALVLQRWEDAEEGIELARKQLRYLVAKDLQQSVDFRAGRIKELREGWDAIVTARKVLETTPDNPSACLAEGRYRCFYEGDWKGGLPLLAKAGDTQLSELARKDLESPGTDKSLETGDAWYEAAKNNKLHAAGFARASFFYRLAIEKAPAIHQERIRRRLDEIGSLRLPQNLLNPEPRPIHLRPLLESWNSN